MAYNDLTILKYRLRAAIHSVKTCTSLGILGSGIFHNTSTFNGLGSMPRLFTICPKDCPDETPNAHFFGLSHMRRPCTPPRQFSIEDSLCAKEIVDQDGKSSLLSPVKAFDSVVLAIYEVLQILRFSVFRFALLLLS
ncbi:hypothetical protein L3X38_043038 [Prunus dulcis]|uniref:Uncharacterized protein n=1 Tax=Prunus dulcis TaxID=3755 RepID=A0AAD4UY26_PRUDU|nr:hypothetical protein L3X38_043038 [Prunus dulcis]